MYVARGKKPATIETMRLKWLEPIKKKAAESKIWASIMKAFKHGTGSN